MSCPSCVVISPTTPPAERVALLMRLAEEGARDPRIQTIAQALVAMLSQRLQRRPTSSETAQFFADALHLLAQYIPDPDGQEVFQSVQQTLGGGCGSEDSPITGKRKGCGDCEDLASAFVALCMVVGIPARVVWLEQPGAPLNHVSAQVRTDPARPDEWLWMETTIPGARLGENPYAALQRLGEQFRQRVFGVEDVAAPAGFLFNVALNLPTTTPPPPASTTDLIVVGMPHGGVVDVDNARIVGGSWDDAELTRWRVRVPANVVGGLRRVLVTAADGSQREQFVTVPGTGSVEVQHATMTPPVQGSVAPARVVVDTMPHGGSVMLDSTPVNGVWLDPSLTRWAVTVPPGLAGARRRIAVQREGEAALSGLVDVPRTGDAVVRYGQLRPDGNVVVDASGTGADLIVVGMPHGGEVAIGGRLLTTGRWQDAAMTRWVVPVPPAFQGTAQEVRVVSGRSTRTQTVTLPTAGVAVVQFDRMAADTFNSEPLLDPTLDPGAGMGGGGGGGGVQTFAAPELVVVGMPHGGSVSVGGTPVHNGRWLDAGMTRWAVAVPAGAAGARGVVVEVMSPEAGTRRGTVNLPRAGRAEVLYAQLVAQPVLEAPPEAPTLTIQAMPHYGVVGIDGVQVTTGRWADAGMTRWEIALAPAQVGEGRLVTVAPPEGPTRSSRVTLAPDGATVVDFAAMSPDTVTPMGRVVVRGVEPRSELQARVVRLVDGSPTQAVYLEPDPLGYLARSLPVGAYHLELEREPLNGRQTVRSLVARVPVTVALGLDSVYDVTPEGLVFRPNITDARVSPRALTATARVTVSNVPKTDQTPGALNLDATVWSLRAIAGGAGESVSNENMPEEGARGPLPWINGEQQPDGTSFVVEVPRGTVQFRLERIRRADGGGVQVMESYTLLRDVTGDVVIPFADFARTSEQAAPGEAPTLRVTGVPEGWQVELTGAIVDGPKACPRAIDGCEARVVPGGVVTIVLRNEALGLQTGRRLDAPTTSTTVDVSFDVRRALHLKAQPEGITSTSATGLRCGYWSASDAFNPAIPEAARHRVVREFEPLTRPDALGRTLRVMFVQGRGFTLGFGTDAQFARFARDLALLQTGRANVDGHFPFEVKGPSVATAGA